MRIKWTGPTIGAIVFLFAGFITVVLKASGIWSIPSLLVAYGLLAGLVSILAAFVDQVMASGDDDEPDEDPPDAAIVLADVQRQLDLLAQWHKSNIRIL